MVSLILFALAGVAMVTALVWAEIKKAKGGGLIRTKAHLAVRGGSGALLVATVGFLTWAIAFPPSSLRGMAWLITGIVCSLFLLFFILAVLDVRMVRLAGRRKREELLSALEEEVLRGGECKGR